MLGVERELEQMMLIVQVWGFKKGKCTYMQHSDLCKLTKELKCSDHCTQFFIDANSTDKAVVRGENSRGSKCIVIKRSTLAYQTQNLQDMGKFEPEIALICYFQ